MCGILGGISPQQLPVLSQRFSSALSLLFHRGPDAFDQKIYPLGQYSFSDHHLLFGHTRLSIIDLSSAGTQPFSLPHKSHLHLVFNGEIYNYDEIRNILKQLGYQFTTFTDTEVLFLAWSEWGLECLQRLNGIFSFSVYDSIKKELIIVRDPFGVKPVYYTPESVDGEYFFSSEIPPILNLVGAKLNVSRSSVLRFLTTGDTDYSSVTFFDNIATLLPGHFVKFDFNTFQFQHQISWWDPDITTDYFPSFADSVNSYRSIFLHDLSLQQRSDVPIGCCLSGGIDSSSIVSSLRYLFPDQPIHTFTFLSNNPKQNEQIWAESIINHTNSISHFIRYDDSHITADFLDLVHIQAQPFGSSSILAQYITYKVASAHGIKVMLDGQGADEIHCGYSGFQSAYYKTYLNRRDYYSLFRAYLSRLFTYPASFPFLTAYLLRSFLSPSLLSLSRIMLPLTAALCFNLPVYCSSFFHLFTELRRSYSKISSRTNYLSYVLYQFQVSLGLPALLRYSDHNSMRFGIESRVPFLSTKASEFLLNLPPHYLASRSGITKNLLRHSLRGIVPDETLNRQDKIGFSSPDIDVFIVIYPLLMSILSNLKFIPCLNTFFLQKYFRRLYNHPNEFRPISWRILSYVFWFYHFEKHLDY